jgi:uncharacterized protein
MNTDKQPASSLNASAERAAPWWRFPMMWLVLGGPLAVVVASIVTVGIAWTHIDPVIDTTPENPKSQLAPALKARNHAATPDKP